MKMLCGLLGHKYLRREVVDQWGTTALIRYSHCVRRHD